MAEKFLKIVQDGISSLIPDTKFNRAFWTKQNVKVDGTHNVQKELVTILTATEDDLAYLKQPAPIPAKAPTNELQLLKDQVAEQQALINKLFLGQTGGEEEVKERGKPGPKPKDKNNGEN